MSQEYDMGSGWGDCLNWVKPEEFSKPFGGRKKFAIIGHKPRIPNIGDTLKAEFQKTWKYFKFVSVSRLGDPPDMFSADVVCIREEPK